MRLKFLALGLSLAGAALLSACGGGDDNNNSGDASVRLLNLSVGYPSLELREVDATNALNSGIAFGAAGSYTNLSTSNKGIQIRATGSTTTLASPSTAGLIKDRKVTVIGWGQTGAASGLVLDEEEAAPDANKSKLLVFNLASGSGALDAYLTTADAALADVSADAPNVGVGRSDSYRILDSKAYRLRVTAAGNKQDIRLDVPAITLASTKVYALFLTSAAGGSMVNATLLTYKDAVQNFENGTSNVRLLSALPRGTTLSASLNGKQLLNGDNSPVKTAYENVLVTNGANLTWAVNGTAQPLLNVPLVRSSTYGLLVWGDPAAPTVSTLLETSPLPINAGEAKIRVVHGALGIGAVSLVVNLSAAQSGIQPGTLSGLTTVKATEDQRVEVRFGSTTVYAETRSFQSGAFYTLLLSGVPGAYEATVVQETL